MLQNQGSASKNQRRREIDADEDYNYSTTKGKRETNIENNNNNDRKRREFDNTFVYDNGELGLNLNHFDGIIQNLGKLTKNLPKVNFQLDPVINFKLKQKISHFGACITLGKRNYLTEDLFDFISFVICQYFSCVTLILLYPYSQFLC